MPRSVRNRPARHGAGPGLVTIACLAGAALAVDRAVRHAPAALRGARDVLAAATISAVILTAVAVLVIITWAALRSRSLCGLRLISRRPLFRVALSPSTPI